LRCVSPRPRAVRSARRAAWRERACYARDGA
jgi:hypothetical protein